MYKTIIIGIDQSYTRTGVSIVADKKILKVFSENFKGCKNNTEKRQKLAVTLNKIINQAIMRSNKVIIICERIRTFSGKKAFISTDYIKATGALIATLVDIAYNYNVPVFSVATNSWKAQVLGSVKNRTSNKKLETIEFVNKLGIEINNDDEADSVCIALYGFLNKEKRCLKAEK